VDRRIGVRGRGKNVDKSKAGPRSRDSSPTTRGSSTPHSPTLNGASTASRPKPKLGSPTPRLELADWARIDGRGLAKVHRHGRRRAHADQTRGNKRVGRRSPPPARLIDSGRREADRGEEALAEIGRSYNISHSTISRLKIMWQRQTNAYAH
jgi:hypothetical protein